MTRRKREPVAPRADDGLELVYVLSWYDTRGIVPLFARPHPERRGFVPFQGPRGGWVRAKDIFRDRSMAAAEAHRRLTADIARSEAKTQRLKKRRRRLFARPGPFEPDGRS